MPSEDIYFELYKLMCASCPNAKKCHEECEECDEFQDELERLEKENNNEQRFRSIKIIS